MISKILPIVLAACLAPVGFAQATTPAPPGWHLFGMGQADPAAAITCPAYDGRDSAWAVSVSAGAPRFMSWEGETIPKVQLPAGIVRPTEMGGRQTVVRVAGGYLLGADKGEFGGGLWFAGNDRSEPIHLSSENVAGIFPTPNGALVITGLAHLGLNRGMVYLATTGLSSEWVLLRTADLGSAPQAALQESATSVVVATTKQLVHVDAVGSVKVLGGLPTHLHINSVAETPDGAIYVGTNYFVFRFLPADGKYAAQAMLPDSCKFSQRLERNGGTRCGCGETR